MSKYGTWTRGQDEALINILGGQEIAEGILVGRVKISISMTVRLREVMKVVLPAALGKKTADCFKDDVYTYREDDIDKMLPPDQPETQGVEAVIYELAEPVTFKDMAQHILKTSEEDLKV